MAKMSIVVGVAEGRQEAVIQINQGETPLAHVTLDAVGLDDLIRKMAACRRQLAEQVPATLEPTFRIETENQPAWRVPAEHNMGKGHVLCLRHSGLGWLAFHLEPERAEQISNALKST